MKENIVIFLNHFLGNISFILFLGIAIGFFAERKALATSAHIFVSKKSLAVKKNFQKLLISLSPLFKRLAYVIGGYLLILFSFAIVNNLLNLLSPPSLTQTIAPALETSTNFWTFLKFQAQFTGLFAVIAFIIAGVCLILSAGNKWLVNITKILITLNFFYIFISVLAYFA